MLTDEKLIRIKDLVVKPNKKIKLKDFATKYEGKTLNKADSEQILEMSRKHLAEIQDELYAHNKYSVLIVFQDGCCRERWRGQTHHVWIQSAWSQGL